MQPLAVKFIGGDDGPWRVTQVTAVVGDPLPPARALTIVEGGAAAQPAPPAAWALRGVTSNDRYLTGEEQAALAAIQPSLGRAEATLAALIPITKSERWWELAAAERRRIFEEASHHVTIGLEYLPPVARRLHHGRELGEPFDFLTWFEFAPEHAKAFDDLVTRLRETEEWSYVVREIDIRLSRDVG